MFSEQWLWRMPFSLYKNPVLTPQEAHYVSATEPSQLMLCKIWDFHCGDYEECHLLGYKNPVRTSQETHYVSATEPSQLILCKIWGFHGGDYKECRLLGCYAAWFLYEPTFRRNVAPLSSGWKESVSYERQYYQPKQAKKKYSVASYC
jgi:hypothetical protein